MKLFLEHKGRWLNEHGFGEPVQGEVSTSPFTATGHTERCSGCGRMGAEFTATREIRLEDRPNVVVQKLATYSCCSGPTFQQKVSVWL